MSDGRRYEPIEHPGWFGLFTRDEYPGALRNGTRIVKVLTLPGDAHPVGTRGVVLGSMGHPEVGLGYFVEWETKTRVAVFVEANKIDAAPGRASG
jgi:hypothetical protein